LHKKLKSIPLDFSLFKEKQIKDAAMLSLIFHDFGKSTVFFQEYISDVENYKGGSKNKEHSLISAVIGFNIINEILQNDVLSGLSYWAILRHHSNVKDFEGELLRDFDDSKDIFKKYNSMKTNKDEINLIFNQLLKNYGFDYNLNLKFTSEEFEPFIEELSKLEDVYFDYVENLKEIREVKLSDIETSLAFMFIYSALLYSDKTEAIFNEEAEAIEPEDISLFSHYVDKYKSTLPKSTTESKKKINEIREQIYNEAMENISDKTKINLSSDKVLALTVPTGGGKTITSIALAGKINEITGKKGKIIYSLPFITLIEQNQEVIRKIHNHNGIETRNNDKVMLSHHYLSEGTFDIKNTEVPDYDKSEYLIDIWNTNLIMTTFVKLIDTFMSNRNKNIKRFIQLANSIIIIDEIQSFPIKYHKLLSMLVQALSRIFNIHFIFMSATMPYIFEKGDYKEILTNPEKYYKPINRTSINYIPTEYKIDELSADDTFIREYNIKDTSLLIVNNTVKSSIKLYKYFKEHLKTSRHLIYLSTNIIPKHRQERVEKVRKLLDSNQKVCLISTQVVEAGVDLDFPKVIRDMAPLDSINQIGGRCNRNGFNEEVPYYVIKLIDGNYKTSRIYDGLLLGITEDILKDNNNHIKEKNFYYSADSFFNKIKEKSPPDFIENWKMLCRLDYGNLDIDLIEKRFPVTSVFVQIDEDAEKVWKEYEEKVKKFIVRTKNDFIKKRKNYLSIKNAFNSYIISVPVKYTKDLAPVYEKDESFKLLFKDDLDRYYDKDTGLIRLDDDEGSSAFIL
ncbi:MAG: CRISPR-associated helicase Cas3', partial [Spirochaetota bacterium]